MHILELNIYTADGKARSSNVYVLIHPLDQNIFHLTMYCSSQNVNFLVFVPKPILTAPGEYHSSCQAGEHPHWHSRTHRRLLYRSSRVRESIEPTRCRGAPWRTIPLNLNQCNTKKCTKHK
jgi:hypothetical protein